MYEKVNKIFCYLYTPINIIKYITQNNTESI